MDLITKVEQPIYATWLKPFDVFGDYPDIEWGMLSVCPISQGGIDSYMSHRDKHMITFQTRKRNNQISRRSSGG